MSENLLDGLMRLFALLAREGSVTVEETLVVHNFLRQQLPQQVVPEYMRRFEQYANTTFRSELGDIATDVSRQLTPKQKLVVVVLLMELIYADRQVSPAESLGVARVAERFQISNEEYAMIEELIQRPDPQNMPHRQVLRIGPATKDLPPGALHLDMHDLPGYLTVVHFPAVETFLLRYQGKGEVLLNGQPLTRGRVYFLAPGSVIRHLHHTPVFYSDVLSAFLRSKHRPQILFEAQGLQYRFPSGKTGLHDVSLREHEGCMVGLMGASGSGKSTLLNVLNGNLVPNAGRVKINGFDVHRQREAIEGVIGYVSQDDLLIEELTVYQNLYYNARLCFADKSEAELDGLVMRLLGSLGLAETRDIQVGNPLNKKISGGQRKRLNIALELIREPSVLFVDEPTSGLSSRDSENIMDLLKELALRGKLVFVVIHQPSSDIFKMFDRLFILDVGGWPIYYGNPVEAISYFKRESGQVAEAHPECIECGNVNPEQIFNLIEARTLDENGNLTEQRRFSPADWHSAFQRNFQAPPHEPPPAEKPATTLRRPSRIGQWRVLSARDIRSKLANTSYLVINFLEAPLLAVILAGILRYTNQDVDTTTGYTLWANLNLPAYLFISILVALFMGLTVSAEEILRDRRIRKREAFLHLSRGSYLMSKVLILFGISAIQTASFVLIGDAIMGITEPHMLWAHFFVLFTASCFANLLGLNISASFDNAVTIYILVPILLIPQIILSGVIVKFDKLNPSVAAHGSVPLIGDAMASRWAYEALAVKYFRDNAFERQFFPYDQRVSDANYKMGFWLRKLEGELDFVQLNLDKPDQRAAVGATLDLMRRELTAELSRFRGQTFPVLDELQLERFRISTVPKVKATLQALRDFYAQQANDNTRQRDQLVANLQSAAGDTDYLTQLKLARANEALTDLVTNRNDELKIMEVDGRLVRNADPIYHVVNPDARSLLDYRVHFFAPRKPLLGQLFDTYAFNLVVIWLMTLALYGTLYYEVFRRSIRRVSRRKRNGK